MNTLIGLLFVFEFCSTIGWGLEVIYRSFVEKELKNPGFLSGCCLPIYGIGGLVLYSLSFTAGAILNPWVQLITIYVAGSLIMSVIELIGGMITEKLFHIRLWDYSKEFMNYKGFICLKFSLIWGIFCVGFFYLIYPLFNPLIKGILSNPLYLISTGVYFGVFSVDLSNTIQLATRIKAYTKEIKQIVDFENLKRSARDSIARYTRKNPLRIVFSQNRILDKYLEDLKNNTLKTASRIKEKAVEFKEIGEKIREDAEEKLRKMKNGKK